MSDSLIYDEEDRAYIEALDAEPDDDGPTFDELHDDVDGLCRCRVHTRMRWAS